MQPILTQAPEMSLSGVPLVVDLDGTLVRSDLLVESAFAYLGHHPGGIGALVAALFQSKAALKAHIAADTDIDASLLPYDGRVDGLVREARAAGRPVYLASASNERYVGAVAAHVDQFDGWFASCADKNLSSYAKAARLVDAFGEYGFDYVGNDAADIVVWAKARRRVAIDPSAHVRRKLLALDPAAVILSEDGSRMRHWFKLLRVHQWVKNALVFVPLVTAHRFDLVSVAIALVAFFAFSLAASGIYIINDLVDLEADRKHRTKRNRPLASGSISVVDAVVVAPALVAAAVVGAFLLDPLFSLVVVVYLALTTAYTFVLKRKVMVDVVTLAILYTIRVIGGAAAISVPVSEWLLAFSMFIFVALALIKRYTELAGRLDANMPDPTNRDYRKVDLDIVAALAAASGFNAVTVFTLYVSSDTVRQLYAHPQVLWLICPILMYWIGRILMLAHRRQVDEDPILFAVKDGISIAAAIKIGAILIMAK